MKKNIKKIITCLLFTVSVQAMTAQKNKEKLMSSTCNYDLGLGDFKVDWESGESKAFIKSLEDRTLKVYPQSGQLEFESEDHTSYCYSMEVAGSKFYIIEKNARINKIDEYILRYLFLNEDINSNSSSKCIQPVRNRIEKIYGDNHVLINKVLKCIITMIAENREKLKKSFKDENINDLAVIVKEPLFFEHIDDIFLKQFESK